MIHSSSKKATREMTREHNERLVLKHIYEHETVSRAQLARLTSLTRATVSNVVSRLMEEELVVETGISRTSVGKPATMLSFNADAAHIICLDLGNRQFSGSIRNLRGELRGELEQPLAHEIGQAAIDRVLELIVALRDQATRPLLGVGIGTPGVVEPYSGVVRRSADLHWEQVPLAEMIERKLDLQCWIANDSQVAALGQYVFGSNKTEKNLILLKAGRGIGAGIIINGNIFYGDGFGAGEIGHVVVDPNGAHCDCGQNGCLETLVGVKSLIQRTRQVGKTSKDLDLNHFSKLKDPTSSDLLELFHKNKPELNQLLNEGANALGSALAFLIGALNIGFVYLTGRMTEFGQDFLDPLQSQTKGCSMPFLMSEINVKVSEMNQNIVQMGATALVLQRRMGLV